jgi:hypothetical protein
LEIPDATYITWLNSLQQLLYTEIIKEQRKTVFHKPNEYAPVSLKSISVQGQAPVNFEDIHAVYADDIQLIKSTVTSGVIFPNTYYKQDDDIAYNATVDDYFTIVYYIKPALIELSTYRTSKVMLPIEFIELAKSKLRGEAYKLANEDSLSAKWLNDYNILLETFKAWVTSKSSNLGL